MTTMSDTRGAGPVDFEAFGDYTGRPKKQQDQGQQHRGEFNRPAYPFQGRISADGSTGFPAQAGRYHLYISWACPWAQRSAIVRSLLGLTDVISLSAVDPIRDGRGWAFREGDGHGLDPVNGFAFIREAYEATEPGYDGHMSVPVLWDKEQHRIVSNNFPDITIDMETQFGQWSDQSLDLYPEGQRAEIDELCEQIYVSVNNGVYRSGFASTQDAYHSAVVGVFAMLDSLEQRLGRQRYLMGDNLTEADVRLWVTLARFDAVYYPHFKTSLRRLTDYPNLWAYARDLYARPAFRDTTNFDHIKRHYFVTQGAINPSRIVPDGPLIDWAIPHGRDGL